MNKSNRSLVERENIVTAWEIEVPPKRIAMEDVQKEQIDV